MTDAPNDLVTELLAERNGYRVVVNDTESFFLSKSMYRQCPLEQGETFDYKEYKMRLLAMQYPEALARAVKLLAVRARSQGEIRQRLERAAYLPDAIDLTLYRLEKEGFLKDEAFARDWVEARSNRQLGQNRIMQELRQKGVDDDVARQALEERDTDSADEQAKALASKLISRYAALDAREAMQKSVNALLRRGYPYAQARKALQAAIEDMEH